MTLAEKLRLQTSKHHQQIEQNSLFKKITENTISLSDYVMLLKKLFGFWQPIESVLLCTSSIPFYSQERVKLPLLQQDLQNLGIAQAEIDSLPYCSNIPTINNYAACLGSLYVLEGSMLGGQVITKLLSTQLGITPATGCAYFYGYGKQTLFMWQQFCQQLNTLIDDVSHQMAIQTAIDTFIKLDAWIAHH